MHRMAIRIIRVASDCSGWCSEVQAAKALGQPIEHVFASDTAKPVQKLVEKYFKPKHLFNDAADEKPVGLPQVDVYVCGWPCQSFSKAGLKRGIEDTRGTVVLELLQFISTHTPNSFIIENVPNLVSQFTEVFESIIEELQCESTYHVTWDIRDSRVHGGLPQTRQRVYIVGIKKSSMLVEFTWPKPRACKQLKDILSRKKGTKADYESLSQTFKKNVDKTNDLLISKGMNPFDVDAIYNVGGSKPHWTLDACPTITASRGSQRAFWSSKRFRLLDVNEMMKLQGAQPSTFTNWDKVISTTQMGRIIGNAMTVPIVEDIMAAILVSLGVRDQA